MNSSPQDPYIQAINDFQTLHQRHINSFKTIAENILIVDFLNKIVKLESCLVVKRLLKWQYSI